MPAVTIFSNPPRTSYPHASLEEFLTRDPEVIIDMGDMAETTAVSDQHKKDVVALYQRYGNLKAVREKRVYAVASDIFVVPGPRVVEALEALARMIHPEAWR